MKGIVKEGVNKNLQGYVNEITKDTFLFSIEMQRSLPHVSPFLHSM